MTDTPAYCITGVDFVAVPTQDFEASIHFYGTVLGLPPGKRWGNMPGAEFQAGNLTLAVMELTDMIDSGVCHQAIFLDPAGNALGLHHRYAPKPD